MKLYLRYIEWFPVLVGKSRWVWVIKFCTNCDQRSPMVDLWICFHYKFQWRIVNSVDTVLIDWRNFHLEIICLYHFWGWRDRCVFFLNMYQLRGNCTPNQTWASFVHYLKIIDTIFWKMIWLSWSKMIWETQKLHWFFFRHSGSWVIDQNMQVSQNICFKKLISFFFSKKKKIVDNFEIAHKYAQFWFGVRTIVPP